MPLLARAALLRLFSVWLIVSKTNVLKQLVNCKPRKNSTHRNTLIEKTLRIRFQRIVHLGQKKSMVSGTSMSAE